MRASFAAAAIGKHDGHIVLQCDVMELKSHWLIAVVICIERRTHRVHAAPSMTPPGTVLFRRLKKIWGIPGYPLGVIIMSSSETCP